MSVEFTQYLRPNGKRRAVRIDLDDDIAERHAQELMLSKGASFDVEELTTGEVSLTCEWEDSAGWPVTFIEVVPNGPGILEAARLLVERAYYSKDKPRGEEE